MIHPLIKGGTALLNAPDIIAAVGVHQGAVVADLGCGGAGHFVLPTAYAVGPSGHVYALDIQKSVLHNVESRLQIQRISNVSTQWSNLEKAGATQIPDHSCDFAFLINVLFQNKDHSAIVSEARRFLKPDGVLAVIEWKKTASPFGPPLDFRVDSATIKVEAERAGFIFMRSFEPGVYHHGLLFKAKL